MTIKQLSDGTIVYEKEGKEYKLTAVDFQNILSRNFKNINFEWYDKDNYEDSDFYIIYGRWKSKLIRFNNIKVGFDSEEEMSNWFEKTIEGIKEWYEKIPQFKIEVDLSLTNEF